MTRNRLKTPISIAKWSRNDRQVIRVRLDHYKGHNTIDIRTWFRKGEKLYAMRNGITLSVKHLPALAQGLRKAHSRAKKLGLLLGEHHEQE